MITQGLIDVHKSLESSPFAGMLRFHNMCYYETLPELL